VLPDTDENEDDGKLAYLDMNNMYYYTGSLGYYGLIVIGAIFIPDVDIIFEFAGTICVNFLSFVFPGVFYLVANSRYKFNRDRNDSLEAALDESENSKTPPPANKILVGSAYFQMGIGIVGFSLGMFSNIYGIING